MLITHAPYSSRQCVELCRYFIYMQDTFTHKQIYVLKNYTQAQFL